MKCATAVCHEHAGRQGVQQATRVGVGRRTEHNPRSFNGQQHHCVRLLLQRGGRAAPQPGGQQYQQAQSTRATLRHRIQRVRVGRRDRHPERQQRGQLSHERRTVQCAAPPRCHPSSSPRGLFQQRHHDGPKFSPGGVVGIIVQRLAPGGVQRHAACCCCLAPDRQRAHCGAGGGGSPLVVFATAFHVIYERALNGRQPAGERFLHHLFIQSDGPAAQALPRYAPAAHPAEQCALSDRCVPTSRQTAMRFASSGQ